MVLKNKKIAVLVLCAAALMNLAGCSDTEAVPAAETTATEPEMTVVPLIADENGNLMSQFEEFELTSEDIEDGFWVDAISSSPAGDDVSPQLSWDPVDGSDQYIIYMVDISAQYSVS